MWFYGSMWPQPADTTLPLGARPSLSARGRGISGACERVIAFHVGQQQYALPAHTSGQNGHEDFGQMIRFGFSFSRLRPADKAAGSHYSAARSSRDGCAPAQSLKSCMIHQKLKKHLWFYEWTHTLPKLMHFTWGKKKKEKELFASNDCLPSPLEGSISDFPYLRICWGISPVCLHTPTARLPQRSQLAKAKTWKIFTQFPFLFVRFVFKLDTWRLNHCRPSSNQ